MLATAGRNRLPHRLPRNLQVPGDPPNPFALDEMFPAYPPDRLHRHHPRLCHLRCNRRQHDGVSRGGQHFDADPPPSRSTIPRRFTNQTTITVTSTHGKAGHVRRMLAEVVTFFKSLRPIAEQLTDLQRWCRILSRALVKYLKGRQLGPPPISLPACLPSSCRKA